MADIPEVVARTLGSVQGGRLLEVGCGDGEFTEMLVEQLASYERIDAVDADEDALEQARAYFATAHPDAPVEFSGADATGLPFGDDAFDTVVLSNTIHHLEAPGQALGELMRVLREEGTLIVHEMVSDVSDPREQVGRDLHHLKAMVDRTHGIPHNPTLTRGQLGELLDRDDLDEVERHEYRPPEPESADVDLDDKLENLDYYADYAAGHPEYADIRREVVRLKQRVRAIGFASPPQQLLLYRKVGDAGDRRHQ
ncbi:MAG: methyltransferase domain-containing protein [Spirochaetes bacterium]|jgi:SAM-dependent methyltransferase|nr:methyltransferase domain-containing protein [Spirochaetota bacterium]